MTKLRASVQLSVWLGRAVRWSLKLTTRWLAEGRLHCPISVRPHITTRIRKRRLSPREVCFHGSNNINLLQVLDLLSSEQRNPAMGWFAGLSMVKSSHIFHICIYRVEWLEKEQYLSHLFFCIFGICVLVTRAAVTHHHGLGGLQAAFISHGSGAWEVQDQAAGRRSGVRPERESSFWFTDG